MTGRVALAARQHLPWRALALAALLCVLLGVGLSRLEPIGTGASSPAAAGASAPAGLSAAARASISAAIGAEAPAYRFSRAGSGFRGSNPAQHLGIALTRSEAVLHARKLTLGVSLRELGYGGALQPVSPAEPAAADNRVTYARGGVSESYVNGPLGLEQGFTVEHAPVGVAAGPLTLAMGLSGDARASLAADAQSVTFHAARGGALRYTGLRVIDAGGHALRSWLALDGRRLLLRVNTAGARFPLRVDPTIEVAEEKLKAGGGEEDEAAGLGVALSGDGNTALVGAPDGETLGGAVWVFTRSGEEWKQAYKLTIPAEMAQGRCVEGVGADEEGNECGFGRSVAVSADGRTALIGAPREREQAGAAWVFTLGEAGWSAQELESPEPGMDGHFGRGVDLSANGETAVVGAPGEGGGSGRAWVFALSGSAWLPDRTPLVGGGEEGEGRFGRNVALSGDGDIALIGAPGESDHRGAAWVFERAGEEWVERGAKLTGAGVDHESRFGYSVALSGDGSTALVGGPGGQATTGAAWVFQRSGEEWVEQGPALAAGGEAGEQFGLGVALTADGNEALIGSPHENAGAGGAWQFERSGSTWTATKHLFGGLGGGLEEGKARFGASVAVSADGSTLLVGGPYEADKSGAAFIFGRGPAVTAVSPAVGLPAGGTEVKIVGQHFGDASAVHFGAGEAERFEVKNEGEILAVSPPGEGTVNVTVTTPFGTTEKSDADLFAYLKTEKTNEPPPPPPGEEPKEPKEGHEPEQQKSSSKQLFSDAGGQVLAVGPSQSQCAASLISKRIGVHVHGVALFRLLGTGGGSCRGKLRLRVKLRVGHGQVLLKTIGTAVFSISSGRRIDVKVKLNATGRRVLTADGGKLNGSLLIVRSSPVPVQGRTASVRLTRHTLGKPKS